MDEEVQRNGRALGTEARLREMRTRCRSGRHTFFNWMPMFTSCSEVVREALGYPAPDPDVSPHDQPDYVLSIAGCAFCTAEQRRLQVFGPVPPADPPGPQVRVVNADELGDTLLPRDYFEAAAVDSVAPPRPLLEEVVWEL